ncbi:DUF3945 domain-containing protein [Prolixibacter sp. NT017]|uniref:DUF3945 domain-containing protein n=1 Tax=Prolixibacter sp. NT017 TaxID=2652390 RepID=UPI0012867918|nr:DUF3945 domain-containing protein [Prolixibacter sp. NT017]GET24361.1 hypothetical protein NT017_06900 [Prolixibacter sp. NT017]
MDKDLTSETLLVAEEKEQGKPVVKAATGKFNKDGTPQTVSAREKSNPDFLRIDRHGNALENFFSNFMRQCKNPTQFSFFKVPINSVSEMSIVIGDILKNGYESGKELLDEYRVKPEDYSKRQNKEQQTEEQTRENKTSQTNRDKKPTAISENEVDWDSLQKLGVSKEMLQKRKCLDTMLNYGKSPLLPVKMDLDGISVDTQARLAFRKGEDDKLTVAVHGVRQQPELDKPFYSHQFTDEEKKALLETGNLGKVLDLKKSDGSILPVYVSIDKLTNEIVALRADKINIPDEIKGVRLNERQKQELQEGKAVLVENMTARSGKEFSAYLQVNAEKRGLEFIFNNQVQNQQINLRIPKKLGGVSLTEKQQADLKAERTIYVQGLTDKKGEKYNAYIKVNPEKGKLDFFKWNPDKAQEKTPDNAHKTQEAVNSQGKTNEATKNVQEPLKPGQTRPNEKQQGEEAKQQKSKAKGLKV